VYQIHVHAHTYTYACTTTVIPRRPSHPATTSRVRPYVHLSLSLSLSLSVSLLISRFLALFLSGRLPPSLYSPRATYGYSPCNKSPLLPLGGDGRLAYPPRRVESGAFSSPTNRATPPWSPAQRGHLLNPLNGYDGGGARISQSSLYSVVFHPASATAFRVSLSSGTYLPGALRHPATLLADFAAESRTLDISNATSQRGRYTAISQSG
jgi:hypothetical protein